MFSSRSQFHRTIPIICCLALLLVMPGQLAAERPAAAKLLPESTAVILSIPDAKDLSERFMNTALGRMSQDPEMKPLVEYLYGSLADAVAGAEEQIGASLPDLLAIPQGELTLAVVAPDEAPPAMVILLDVGSQLSTARKLLDRGIQEIERSGADKSIERISGIKVTIYDGVGPRRRKVLFFEKDTTIVACTDLEVAKQILTAWNGKAESTLADNEHFAAVMSRCQGPKGQSPQVFYYADPIALMRSIGQKNVGVQVAVATLPTLGLDDLKGLGGSVTFDAGPFDSVSHFHILMDNPRTGVLEIVALEPGNHRPASWVPADVSTYISVQWRIDSTFNAIRDLIDGFRGEGAWAKMLERRIEKPVGINFEADLLPHLEGHVTHLNWIERPVTITSQATLVGFQLKETEPVEKLLEKVFDENEAFLERQAYAGKSFYRFAPPQLNDQPEEDSDDSPAARRRRQQPRPCFGILGDSLLVTDRISLYQKAIATAEEGSDSLADSLDFKLIAGKIRRMSGGTKPAMFSFNRPEEGMRLIYELAVGEKSREGLQRMAKNNRFLKAINDGLEENPLPPFAVIERYLAPGGSMIVDDQTGIHITDFSLRRKLD